MMNFISRANKLIGKFDYFDMVLIKFGTVAFTLMIAKLWEPILNLNWYWYGLIFVFSVIRPWSRIFIFDNE